MADVAGVDGWQQAVLAIAGSVLVGMLGWILVGRQNADEKGEDCRSGKDSRRPLPVFGANFSPLAFQEASQKKSNEKPKVKVSKEVQPAAAEPGVEKAKPEESAPAPIKVEKPAPVPVSPPLVPAATSKKTQAKAKQAADGQSASQAQPVKAPVVKVPAAAKRQMPDLRPTKVVTPEQTAMQNDIRKIQKKLREITDLKARRNEGAALTDSQRSKLSQEQALLKTAAKAQADLEALIKAAPEVETNIPTPGSGEMVDELVAEDLCFPEEEQEPEQNEPQQQQDDEEFDQPAKQKKKNNRNQRKKEEIEAADVAAAAEAARAAAAEAAVIEAAQAAAAAAAAEEEEVDEEEEEEEEGAEDDAVEGEDVEEEDEEEVAEDDADVAAEDEEEEAAEAGEGEDDQEEYEEEDAADDAAAEEEEEEDADVAEEAGEDDEAEVGEDADAAAEEEVEEAEDQEVEAGEGDGDAAEEEADEADAEEEVAEPTPPREERPKPVYPATEREKEIMKVKKKIREIEDLEKKQTDGSALLSNQQAKLLKKPGLLDELEQWEKAREPHTVEWDATIMEILNPLFGVRVRIEGKSDPMVILASHMSPPIPATNLAEIEARYPRGMELKVRVMRNQTDVTDMSVEDEDYYYTESQEILEELKRMRDADTKLADDLWNANKYSQEEFLGFVTSVKDQCIFVRINCCRDVRISAGELLAEYRYKDPMSHVFKTRREAVTVGMEVGGIKLKYDWKSERIYGSMLRDL